MALDEYSDYPNLKVVNENDSYFHGLRLGVLIVLVPLK